LALLPFADDCEISRYPQAIFTPPVAIPEGLGHAYGMLAAPPNNDGKKPLIAGRFEHLSALPSMAAEGDLVVTIPRRQALQWQAAPADRNLHHMEPASGSRSRASLVPKPVPGHHWR